MKTQPEIELLEELDELHTHWEQAEKTLKWWKNETGYKGCNIRKLCNIPIPHPDSDILIGSVYILHLNYILRRTSCKSARQKVSRNRAEVFAHLKISMQRYDTPIQDEGIFP